MLRPLHIALLLLVLPAFLYSQENSKQPTVTFTLDFPGSQPAHYSVQVQGDGRAQYQSGDHRSSDLEPDDDFNYAFALSPSTRDRIFELAAKARYFQTDLDSHRKKMAFTGNKTLAYKDGQRHGESTFNYSSDSTVQELTSLFQNLAATLELGHRLEFSLRYQKLALAEELKRTEESARMNPPMEIQAIAPILHRIVADSSVLNVTRARAQRLLQLPQGK